MEKAYRIVDKNEITFVEGYRITKDKMPMIYKVYGVNGVMYAKPSPGVVITEENGHEYHKLPTEFEGWIISFFNKRQDDYNCRPTLYNSSSKNRIKIRDFYGRTAWIMKSYLEATWIDREFREWIKEIYQSG